MPSLCIDCGKDLEESDGEHYFCGYGYAQYYCGNCCPIEFDGQTCEEEHLPTNKILMKRENNKKKEKIR